MGSRALLRCVSVLLNGPLIFDVPQLSYGGEDEDTPVGVCKCNQAEVA